MIQAYVQVAPYYTATVTPRNLKELKNVVRNHIRFPMSVLQVFGDSAAEELTKFKADILALIAKEKTRWAKSKLTDMHKAELESLRKEGGFHFSRNREVVWLDTYAVCGLKSDKELKQFVYESVVTGKHLEIRGGFDSGCSMHPNDREPLTAEYCLQIN